MFPLETFYNSYNIEKHTGRKQYSVWKIVIKENGITQNWKAYSLYCTAWKKKVKNKNKIVGKPKQNKNKHGTRIRIRTSVCNRPPQTVQHRAKH